MKTVVLNENNINLFNTVYTPDDNYTLVINHGKPVGLFTSFTNDILKSGLMQWLVLKAFQTGDISLGQLSKQMQLSLTETIDFLGNMNIPVVDYDLDDDLQTIENWSHADNS